MRNHRRANPLRFIATIGLFVVLIATALGCNKKPRAVQSDCAVDPTAKAITDAKSAGCLIVIDGALLVTRVAANGGEGSGKVTPPGGSVDSDESARCSAVRQTFEETGLKVKAGKLFGVWRNNFHLFNCQLIDPKDIGHARTRDVPEAVRGDVSEKLLLELPAMRNRRTGNKELWAFPTNVVISHGYKGIEGLSAGATQTSN